MSLRERYKGQWAYLLSMVFAAFVFAFICYCELTGGIVYPNPKISLMWAVALPSLIAALIEFRDQRLFRERVQREPGGTGTGHHDDGTAAACRQG